MKTLPKIALLAVSITVFIFIYIHSRKDSTIINEIVISKEMASLSDSMMNEIALTDLVNNITSEKQLESDYKGIGGVKSSQPKYLTLLLRWANTKQLVRLTSNSNPLVRILSFEALKEKKYPELKNIFREHLFDQQTYQYQSGCEVGNRPVNISFYKSIYSGLSKTDLTYYKNTLLKQYGANYFNYLTSTF
jgi:hypothetical protein